MKETKENLEGIVLKLKEHGIKAGQEEKYKLVEAGKKQVEELLIKAKLESNQIIQEAKINATQMEKNAQIAIRQSSRDLIEATKIAMLDSLKSVFGKQCENLFTQKEYLQELIRVTSESILGSKTLKVSPEMLSDMEGFLLKQSLSEQIQLKPLSTSDTKIEINSSEKQGVSFVLSAKDVEDALFSLLNKDLVENITKNKES
ncbi:hypothetical protein BZG02_04060 [Labilibaculum filiforme]|uniref:V-type ATP synthase subunit E n=1 Tax=Labilibaculum filiforme TaxID=1940526 RepID=A0A2N3I3X3_9BACT|nr:hypothetical protein [Labilibaculum filiforme]PKQ65020.1 hypothetical protein BZG02_04060 [Labilibaculum filiforme]